MKRLFVTSEYPPLISGQSTYFRNLWEGLDPRDDVLLLPERSRAYAANFPGKRYVFRRTPLGEAPLAKAVRAVRVCLAVFRLALCGKPEEIHAGQFFSAGLAALLCRKAFSVPYVLYVFGADLLALSRGPLLRRLSRAILDNCAGIIACSHFTSRLIRQHYRLGSPICVINPGVEERYFNAYTGRAQALRGQYGLAGKRVLITVGRLVERKGHDIVIGCLRELLKKIPELHYLVVGDGPFRVSLERLSRAYGVAGSVTFCGRVPYGELPAHYLLGEVFIMISRQIEDRGDVEGFGIVYLEANAAGLPVVGARTGGTPDAVNHEVNGVLVEDAISEPEIIGAVVNLFRDDGYRRRLSAQAALFAKDHSWESRRGLWEETLAFYRSGREVQHPSREGRK
jgi:phosphatidylinositol alpha-1,6-mannosyltransferase